MLRVSVGMLHSQFVVTVTIAIIQSTFNFTFLRNKFADVQHPKDLVSKFDDFLVPLGRCPFCYCAYVLRISGLGCVYRKPRKAIYENMINSFYKAVILTCLQGKKCITNRGSLMLRKVFIYRIQSNLSCSKSTRKVSGLSTNAHLVRDIRVS